MTSRERHQRLSGGLVQAVLHTDFGILMISAIILFAIYAIDTVTPLGEPIWLLYCIPLVLAFFSNRYYAIPTVFIVIVLFLVGGFIASPQGIPVNIAIINRMTFFLILFGLTLFLWTIRGRQIREENL